MAKTWLMRRAVRRPQISVDHRAHEFVRMQRALHQRLDLAGAGHGDRLLRRRVAMLRRNDLEGGQIELQPAPRRRGSWAPAPPAPER